MVMIDILAHQQQLHGLLERQAMSPMQTRHIDRQPVYQQFANPAAHPFPGRYASSQVSYAPVQNPYPRMQQPQQEIFFSNQDQIPAASGPLDEGSYQPLMVAIQGEHEMSMRLHPSSREGILHGGFPSHEISGGLDRRASAQDPLQLMGREQYKFRNCEIRDTINHQAQEYFNNPHQQQPCSWTKGPHSDYMPVRQEMGPGRNFVPIAGPPNQSLQV